jgi:hypothetical protein
MPDTFFETVSPDHADRVIAVHELGEGETKIVKIQVLRQGAFKHPQYGKISFDEKTFKSFIKNFEERVPQEHIAYDFKHQPDHGAAAWLKRLFVEEGGLWADVELTKRGAEALKNREFIYFSTEYVDDYKDRESGKSYGPTILGGGLTNRPFIKGMAPTLMSEDREELFVSVEDSATHKEIESMDEIKKQIADLNAKLAGLVDGAQNKEEVQKAFSTVGEQIKSLQEKLDEMQETKRLTDEETAKALEDAKEEATNAKAAQAKAEEEAKNLTESLAETIKDRDAKGEEIKSRDEVIRQQNVDAFCKGLGDKGLWPATVEVVKELMAAGSGEEVVTLSEGEGDDKKDVKVDLMGVITRIVDSIPDEFKVSVIMTC